MGKHYYKPPKIVFKYYCPICDKEIIEEGENVWFEINSHIYIKHREVFKVQILEKYEWKTKKGYVKVNDQELK